ncbi:hypothetical protein COB52_05035 [Candidatus Kaiserbacteria bacterium]|nr:MAG: hypothetical protein COB52_05035 [Candidatus Kaiserbacteria bacterium]
MRNRPKKKVKNSQTILLKNSSENMDINLSGNGRWPAEMLKELVLLRLYKRLGTETIKLVFE